MMTTEHESDSPHLWHTVASGSLTVDALADELLSELRATSAPDPQTGNYSADDVAQVRAWIAARKAESSFRRRLRIIWEKLKCAPGALARTPRVALNWAIRSFLGGYSAGGLLVSALEKYQEFQDALESTFDKGVGHFVRELAFDASCLAVHLATSTPYGRLFSMVEFVWRQFGPLLKISIERLWTNYLWPTFSLMFGKNARSPSGAMRPNEFNELPTSSYFEAVATSAAVVGCLAAGKKVVDNREVSKCVGSWGNLGRDVNNLERGGSTILNLCRTFVGWAKEAVMYFWPEARLGFGVRGEFENVGIDISKFINLHSKYSDITQRQKLATEYKTQPEIVEALRLGNLVTRAIVDQKVKISAAVRQELMTMRRDITDFAKHFEKYHISPPNRRCPMHISFVGEPGCGKSAYMTRVAMEVPLLCTAYGNGKVTPEGEEDFTFHDDGTPKVWKKGGGCRHDDGYNTELKVMTWDDVFAGQGETPDESDAMWMLKTISSMACPLSMADISDKGMEFRCLLMVTSGNEAYPKFPEMRVDRAIYRRRNVLIRVGKDGQLDMIDPNPENINSSPTVLKHFRNLDEALPWLAKKTYDFLQLPLLGGTRLTQSQRETMVEAMHANAGEERVEPAQFVFSREEARYQNRRGRPQFNPEEYEGRMRCLCCAGLHCDVRLRLRCQDRGVALVDHDLEEALQREQMWICHRRGVLYWQGDARIEESTETNPGLILGKIADLSDDQRIIVRFMLSVYGSFVELLDDMAEQMPPAIWLKYQQWEDLDEVWDWSVQQRMDNFHRFFEIEPNAQMPDYEDVMLANAGEESEEAAPAREAFQRWEDSRWTGFCNFLWHAYKWTQEKTRPAFNVCQEAVHSFLTSDLMNYSTKFIQELIYATSLVFLYTVTLLTGISLAVQTVAFIQKMIGLQKMEPNVHAGPSGGDARTTRLAKMRIYRSRANAVEEGIQAFREEVSRRGFPDVADKMEEVMRRKHPQFFANHAGFDCFEMDTLAERFLEKNMILLRMRKNEEKPEEGNWTMQGLGVRGNLCLVPYHFRRRFREEREVEITYRGKVTVTKISPKDFVRCVDADGNEVSDLCVLALEARIGQFPDLLSHKHFVLRQEHADLDGMETQMPSRREDKVSETHISYFKVRAARKLAYDEYVDGQRNEYLIPVGYTYGIQTTAGFCGAPLIKTTAVTHGRIFGIHLAKDARGQSYAMPLDHEFVEENINRAAMSLRANVFEDTPDWWEGEVLGVKTREMSYFDGFVNPITVIPEGRMEYVATLKPGWAERVCNKTDIVPSPIHGVFPVRTAPSVKTGKDTRLRPELFEDPDFTPLNEGAKKYSRPTKPFNKRALELATRCVISCYLLFVKPLGGVARKLTECEMINGVQAWGYTRLNMLTSAGWPHKRLRNPFHGTKGKRFLFELEDPEQEQENLIRYKIRDPTLRRDLDEYQANLNRFKRTFTVTYSNLKDERRPLAKIENGATRLFDCMSLPNTLLVRKYFGAWVATMNSHCVDGYAAIGIDPESPQWSALYRRLAKFGGRMIAGDFKEWDGQLDPDVMMRAVEAINAWYQHYGGDDWSPADDIIRQILITDVIRAFTIYGNTVVFKDQGLPSGMAITADLNSICDLLYMITAFFSLRPSGCSERFEDNVEVTFYGDDHLLAVRPTVQEWFNFNSLRKYYAKHNIQYTDAMKRGGDIPDFVQLENEATFLKRKFVPHPEMKGFILAPIEERTIEELANWIRKTGRPTDALMGNLRDLQAFAYHHGKEYYDKTMEKVNAALIKLRSQEAGDVSFRPLQEDFEEMDDQWVAKFTG